MKKIIIASITFILLLSACSNNNLAIDKVVSNFEDKKTSFTYETTTKFEYSTDNSNYVGAGLLVAVYDPENDLYKVNLKLNNLSYNYESEYTTSKQKNSIENYEVISNNFDSNVNLGSEEYNYTYLEIENSINEFLEEGKEVDNSKELEQSNLSDGIIYINKDITNGNISYEIYEDGSNYSLLEQTDSLDDYRQISISFVTN